MPFFPRSFLANNLSYPSLSLLLVDMESKFCVCYICTAVEWLYIGVAFDFEIVDLSLTLYFNIHVELYLSLCIGCYGFIILLKFNSMICVSYVSFLSVLFPSCELC